MPGASRADVTAALAVLEGHPAREVSWVVRGREGAGFTVVLRHPEGGVDRAEATLEAGDVGS